MFDDRRHEGVRVAQEGEICSGQRSVIHGPAVVDVSIQRHVDDASMACGVAKGSAQCPGQVEPVQTDDQVGLPKCPRGSGREEEPWGGAMCAVRGGKGGAKFQIGQDQGSPAFHEPHASLPVGGVSRDSPHEDHGSPRGPDPFQYLAHVPRQRPPARG
ncbi:hypothetical protein OY671_010710, partial [Metschnikowia pulcherrima]